MGNFFIAFLGVFFSGQQASILFGFSSSKTLSGSLYPSADANTIGYRYDSCNKRGKLHLLAGAASTNDSGDRREQTRGTGRLEGSRTGEFVFLIPIKTPSSRTSWTQPPGMYTLFHGARFTVNRR